MCAIIWLFKIIFCCSLVSDIHKCRKSTLDCKYSICKSILRKLTFREIFSSHLHSSKSCFSCSVTLKRICIVHLPNVLSLQQRAMAYFCRGMCSPVCPCAQPDELIHSTLKSDQVEAETHQDYHKWQWLNASALWLWFTDSTDCDRKYQVMLRVCVTL